MTETAPKGIRPDEVTAWIRDRVGELDEPLRFDVVAHGRSNLTFVVTDDAGRRWVLRRPPTGHVLQSAHDVVREARIVSALEDTAVPVPKVVGACETEDVTGAPFFVMEFVDGKVVQNRELAEELPMDARGRLAEHLVDVLVDLHGVDPDAVGLGDLGRKEDYIARQLRRWTRQISEGSDRDLPLLSEVGSELRDRIPPQQGYGIVHGDYRLDNAIVGPDGRIAAVLDWELCTLGDVLADVGMLVMYWGGGVLPGTQPTTAEGFPSADEAVARYAERSDRDLSALPYYVAFAHWRLACIIEGVRTRFAKGAMGDKDIGGELEAYERGVDALAERARAALDEL